MTPVRQLPLWQVDAFAERAFTGNPAAVMTLASSETLSDELMAAIANENNLSETAFVSPVGPGVFAIRWFTPAAEVDLCGHATLAAAHVMFEHAGAEGDDELVFRSKSGDLPVRRLGPGHYELDFPAAPVVPREVDDALTEALGAEPLEAHTDGTYLLCVFQRREDVEHLSPDMRALAGYDEIGVIAAAGDDTGEVDVVSRFFGPKVGVDEDPVTGSAHCMLAPFFGRRLGTDTIAARQLSARGGRVDCRLVGDRVKLAGRTVEILRGIMDVPVT